MISIEEAASQGFIFFLSVDGTTCPIEEPRPWSKDNSAHKLGGKAGVDYEIGLSICESKMAWRRGPLPSGKQPDISNFRDELKKRIPVGRRVIGDAGYGADEDSDIISTQNELDPKEIAYFKSRVLAPHESFNCQIKQFKIMAHRFRHGLENHQTTFDAVGAVVLYNMENGGKTLFDPYP